MQNDIDTLRIVRDAAATAGVSLSILIALDALIARMEKDKQPEEAPPCVKCGQSCTKVIAKYIFDTHTKEESSYYCFACNTPINAAGERMEQNTGDVIAENKRLKQFIHDILTQCLCDFADPYKEDESHVETMKHCYDQINAFAQKMPDWGSWDYGFEAYCDGFEAGKKSVEKHHD